MHKEGNGKTKTILETHSDKRAGELQHHMGWGWTDYKKTESGKELQLVKALCIKRGKED